jgi:hypothetical protein
MHDLQTIQRLNAEAIAKHEAEKTTDERLLRTGDEVTTQGGTRRGVVVDGHVNLSGKNKGLIEVMWIGGRYTTGEDPAELKRVAQ